MKNIAVILAGGSGSRFGADRPKQFHPLKDGRTVLETCVAAFQQNERIDQIAIVMHPAHKDEAKALLPIDRYDKVRYWIDGGKERWESSLHAVEALSVYHDECNLLIHDCARPFISQDLITRVCQALEKHEAVSVVEPVTDTLYQIDSKGLIVDIPPRTFFRRAQTPQAFRLSLIADAFGSEVWGKYVEIMKRKDTDKLKKEFMIYAPTDDMSVVFRTILDEKLYTIPGEPSNRKITFKEDIV